MKEEIQLITQEEFETRLLSYRKENNLVDRLIKDIGSWENFPRHLIAGLFKRMGCKPIINKY